jgi:pimeloyl-ACP methyl ester carboxylesterase
MQIIADSRFGGQLRRIIPREVLEMRVLFRSAGPIASLAALLAILSLVSAPRASAQATSPADSSLAPCALPGVTRPARCGAIVVPENRRKPEGRRITLRVAVVPALQAPARKDPIAILLGGPGESAVEDAAVYVGWLEPLLVDRDLLLLDQRGAGGSAPLTCPLAEPRDPAPLFKDSFPPAAIERCATALARQADLTQYGYATFAEDLEQVRIQLGYAQLNLFGGSYGTRAEQVYLRRYPASVRTAYLGSVVPIDIATPPTMAATAQVEMERLFEACRTDGACNRAYPQLRREFDEVMQRLERGEARARLAGHGGTFSLHTAPVAAWLRAHLYRPSSAAMLPWAIHRAHAGDWTPIAEGIAATGKSTLSFGLFFAITCNEDVRFIDPRDAERRARGTFLGMTRVRQQQAGCRFWPQSPLPAGYRSAVRSTIPSLFVTGEADGGTPTWFTAHAVRHFARSAVLRAPGQGHTEWSPCIASRYFALVRSGDVTPGKRETCPPVPRPPFKLDAPPADAR